MTPAQLKKFIIAVFFSIAITANAQETSDNDVEKSSNATVDGESKSELFLTIEEDSKVKVFRSGEKSPLFVYNAFADMRPYAHPIMSPDLKTVLTEIHPGHHKHQTGLYWGFKDINGIDYFHNPRVGIYGKKQYYKRNKLAIDNEASKKSWSLEYDLYDNDDNAQMKEKQTWEIIDCKDHYLVDLVWEATALTKLNFKQQKYGGLFLRMPWKKGIQGQATNSKGKTKKLDQKRSNWIDVGMKIEDNTEQSHITIIDNPENPGYPSHWRVDWQLGAGPSPSITGSWQLEKGQSITYKYRFLVYSGKTDKKLIEKYSSSSKVNE